MELDRMPLSPLVGIVRGEPPWCVRVYSRLAGMYMLGFRVRRSAVIGEIELGARGMCLLFVRSATPAAPPPLQNEQNNAHRSRPAPYRPHL
eukprot:9314342-Pyramimonas_sp.AAC.3